MTSTEMKKKLEKIFDHYGELNQLNKLKEEDTELKAELAKYNGLEEIRVETFREMADKLVVLSQFALKYPIIYEIMEQKVDRQIKRMEEEK